VSSEALPPVVAIRCRSVRKTYLVYRRLIRGLVRRAVFPRLPNPDVQGISALQGIDLEIEKGEVFGLLGPNGAGKSTLLACVAGISPIDSGEIEVNGEVEALLRLGVGFNQRFTGRENIVIGLISMGVPVDEAKEAVEPVLDFAELRKFGDMPFYAYSSGMQARLQFSVAVHRTPEILILDEALSSGDGFFTSKANRRIEEICHSGSTIIIVSHNISVVERLCKHAAIMSNGKLVARGTASEMGTEYRRMLSESNVELFGSLQRQTEPDKRGDSGTGEVLILDSKVELPDGARTAAWNEPLKLVVDLEFLEPIEDPRFRIYIYNAHNGVLATSFGNLCVDPVTAKLRRVALGRLEGATRLVFTIPRLPLGGYTYFWSFGLLPKTARRKLESEADHYVLRRVMNHFQVESFPDVPSTIGRGVFTETPVVPTVEKL